MFFIETVEAYSNCSRTDVVQAVDLRSLIWTLIFLFKNPSVWLAFLEIESMLRLQERLSEIASPSLRYQAEGTDSRTVP